jgi:tetratricopeptide (TPR) repeat protein
MQAFCQQETTLFNNEFEQALFGQIADSLQVEPLDLFLSVQHNDADHQIRDRIDSFMGQLNLKLQKQKRLKSRLKTIYKMVHDAFFTKYVEEVRFADIFSSGNYNCVTATALYAIVLNRLEISYMIKQTPTHVYLIADPGKTSYLFESTLPLEGLVQFNPKYQKDFVDYLYKNKIISEREYKDKTTNALFMEYYTKDVNISLTELAGIQYYNAGVFELRTEKFEAAMNNFIKAHMLYPSNTINFMLNIALSVVLDKQMNSREYNPETLYRYFDLNRKDENAMQGGVDYFNNISVQMIIERSQYYMYRDYYNAFPVEKIDTAYGNQIKEIYYYLAGYYHYTQYNYFAALQNLSVACALSPDDLENKQMVKEIIARYVGDGNSLENMLDTLDHYSTMFPFLEGDQQIGALRVYCLSVMINNAFLKRDFRNGNRYIQQLEYFTRNNPDVPVDASNVTSAFAQASASYVQQQEYKQAEEMLTRGLKLAPNSPELQKRLRSVSEFNASFGGGRRGSEKVYNEALQLARRSKTEITRQFYKHGMRKWVTFKVIDGENIMDIQPGQEFDFELKLNRRAKIELYRMHMNGRWVFNEDNCTLTIYMDDQEGRASILITEIDSSKISGIFYMDGDRSSAYRIFLKSE